MGGRWTVRLTSEGQTRASRRRDVSLGGGWVGREARKILRWVWCQRRFSLRGGVGGRRARVVR